MIPLSWGTLRVTVPTIGGLMRSRAIAVAVAVPLLLLGGCGGASPTKVELTGTAIGTAKAVWFDGDGRKHVDTFTGHWTKTFEAADTDGVGVSVQMNGGGGVECALKFDGDEVARHRDDAVATCS